VEHNSKSGPPPAGRLPAGIPPLADRLPGASGRKAGEGPDRNPHQHKKFGSAETSLPGPADFGASRRTYALQKETNEGTRSNSRQAHNRTVTNRRLCAPARLKEIPWLALRPRSGRRVSRFRNANQTCEWDGTCEMGGRGQTPRDELGGHGHQPSTRRPKAGGTDVPHSGPVFVPLRDDGVLPRPPCALDSFAMCFHLAMSVVCCRVVGGGVGGSVVWV